MNCPLLSSKICSAEFAKTRRPKFEDATAGVKMPGKKQFISSVENCGCKVAVDLRTPDSPAKLLHGPSCGPEWKNLAERLAEALRLHMEWMGPPPVTLINLDSLRLTSWAKGRVALAEFETALRQKILNPKL